MKKVTVLMLMMVLVWFYGCGPTANKSTHPIAKLDDSTPNVVASALQPLASSVKETNYTPHQEPAPRVETPKAVSLRPKTDIGHRVALVIGNSAYQSLGVLPNPLGDAGEIARRLKTAGFKLLDPVRRGQSVQANLNLDEMRQAHVALKQAAQEAGLVLLFYAGHGLQMDGRSYLVPVDMPQPDLQSLDSDDGKRTLQSQLSGLDEFIEGLDEHAKLAVTVFDACREIPVFKTQRSLFGVDTSKFRSFRGLARPQSSSKHRILVFSASSGELADDGAHHSPYAQAFIDEFDHNSDQTVSDFFQHVQNRMSNTTGQTPETTNQGVVPTDVYLKP